MAGTPDINLNLCIFAHFSMCVEDPQFSEGELVEMIIQVGCLQELHSGLP